jgi:transcription elongation GreA/GreB family factor
MGRGSHIARQTPAASWLAAALAHSRFALALNKTDLLPAILAALDRELAGYALSARSAHEEATHEQSKAENKYDTRGLEASYLARGQSKQAAETEEARRQFETLSLRAFGPADPLDLGALVELSAAGEQLHYFLGPRAGGTEVRLGKKEIIVITPTSPLGQQLLGKRQGESVEMPRDRRAVKYKIAQVW